MAITKLAFKKKALENYIKKNKLFFILSGTNKNAQNWIITEQEIFNLNLNYKKIINKTSLQSFKNSVFSKNIALVKGSIFFIKPENSITTPINKAQIKDNFNKMLFIILAAKLNNKIYSYNVFKKAYSLDYTQNKRLTKQFYLVSLKKWYKLV